MKKKIANILIVLCALIGIALMAYPSVSQYLSSINQSQAVAKYEDTVNGVSKKQLAQQWKKAEQYNQQFLTTDFYDPFMAVEKQEAKDYKEVLNLNDVMATIKIPALGVDLPVYHGVTNDVLKIGAGHLPTSSLPIGGKGTHSVITAHSGLAEAKLFTDLDELKKDDVFMVQVLDQTLYYRIDQIKKVLPSDVKDLKVDEEKDQITLITCTPYMVNSHRLLIRGQRIAKPQVEKVLEMKKEIPWGMVLLVSGTLVGVGFVLYRFVKKRKRV